MRAATTHVRQRRTRQPRHFLPVTTAGRWAVGLTVACLVLFVASALAAALVVNDGVDRWWEWTLMSTLVASAFLSGLAVVPTAIFAIVRRAERSLLVWFTLAPGGLATIFVIGELIGHE